MTMPEKPIADMTDWEIRVEIDQRRLKKERKALKQELAELRKEPA